MINALTLVHVLLSLVGIAAGFVVLFGLLASKHLDGWAKIFLWTTIATSVTGYFFPVDKLMPSHIVGALSLVALALAVLGLYRFGLAGGWRRTYVITSTIALYFNVFVLVVQSFLKVPALHELAPTQGEPPFAVVQLLVLVGFVFMGWKAVKGFSIAPLARAAAR